MRIVQVDFDSLENEFEDYQLVHVLLDCIDQLAPNGRPDFDGDVTRISDMIRGSQRDINLVESLREYQCRFVNKSDYITLPDHVIANNRR